MTDRAALAVYLDTNVFIKAVEDTAEAAAFPRKLIDALRDRTGMAVTSEITFAEVLASPKRPDALPIHVKRRVYLDLLLWSGFITLVPVSRNILIETADLRAGAPLKLPDAIHLVTAIRGNCRYIVSSDNDFDRLPAGVTRVSPDDRGIEGLLREIA